MLDRDQSSIRFRENMASLFLWRTLLLPGKPICAPPGPEYTPVTLTLEPLVGGPAWMPLHAAIEHNGFRYDFLPTYPESSETAANLLTGQTVDGVVRCRNLLIRHEGVDSPKQRFLLGYSAKTSVELQGFAEKQPRALQLLRNDCWTFGAAVAGFAIGC